MMKKRLLAILFFVLILSLTACKTTTGDTRSTASGGDSISEEEKPTDAGNVSDEGNKPNVVEETAEAKDFDASTVASKIDVKGEFYSSEFSNDLFLILTNNSGVDCDISLSVDLYDDSGKIVGTDSKSVVAFANGTSIAININNDDKFSKYEYTLTAKELSYYHCVDQNLSCEITTATEKAIISVKNNGEENAQFVEYYALFYKGNSICDYDWGFIDDDDSEIKVGATQKKEANCYSDFDSVKVYIHGRSATYYRM